MAVFDTSAALALLFDEPGASIAARYRSVGVMSAVNHAEVLTVLVRRGLPPEEAARQAARLRFPLHSFDSGDATAVARFVDVTARRGLGLGDRACLGLASRLGESVVTADLAWADLDLGLEVITIR